MTVRVTSLHVYPVKSCGGSDVTRAEVTPQGLAGDRRWAVLDPGGHRVSARECHRLLAVTATSTDAGLLLRLGEEELAIPTPGPGAPSVPTRMSRIDRLTLGSDDASAWLTERLGRPLRLVHQADPTSREIGESHGGRPGETMSLADAGPILLVTESSLDRLRDWVAETQGEEWLTREEAARRFRPNVVVDGGEPFAEDGWPRVRIGGVDYRRGELCDRCVLTTIDLTSYETTKEPIRTLARHRKWDGITWFGIRLIPESAGEIAVGDEVEVG